MTTLAELMTKAMASQLPVEILNVTPNIDTVRSHTTRDKNGRLTIAIPDEWADAMLNPERTPDDKCPHWIYIVWVPVATAKALGFNTTARAEAAAADADVTPRTALSGAEAAYEASKGEDLPIMTEDF